ncbi:SpoIIE family protein phosphatase [Streptomyces sp. B21-102]|uniref:SpoIIE family protein phosphatase n=1 Tax=Streptomyces sp. B21-102 TaxID=3039416 RepID=UPI003FA7EE34
MLSECFPQGVMLRPELLERVRPLGLVLVQEGCGELFNDGGAEVCRGMGLFDAFQKRGKRRPAHPRRLPRRRPGRGALRATATTVLAPGDTLLLYTDGLTEARTGGDRTALNGDEALRAFVADHAGKPPQALIQALTGLLDDFGDGLDDDPPARRRYPRPTPDSRTEDTE